MKNNSSKKFYYSWGSGSSSLFLLIEEGGTDELVFEDENSSITVNYPARAQFFDVEFDAEKLHSLCGGRTYYISRSGCSGAGYLDSLGSLIPLGSYRVDTAHNDSQGFLPVGKVWQERGQQQEVLVAVPYVSHKEDKSGTLRSYPTVIKVGDKVIYCDFHSNFLEVLSLILSGKDLPEQCVINGATYGRRGHRTLRRVFTRLNGLGEAFQEEVVMEHYNLCSMNDVPNPWEFFQRELKEYQMSWEHQWEQEKLFHLLSVERLEDGTFVRTVKVDGQRYRGEILPGNPLETGELTAGWQRLSEDVLVRFYDGSNEAHLLAYAKAEDAYRRMGEGEEFVSFVSDHEGEWVEYEAVVPKVLYLIDPAAQLAEARKGLEEKVRDNIISCAHVWHRPQ